MGSITIRASFFFFLCALLCSCSSSRLKGEPSDGQTDADHDTLSDDFPGDPSDDITDADDIETDESPPQLCSGSDTLNLRYVDTAGNPMPDLAVALSCLDSRYEGWTDADGRISFGNLDLAAQSVAVTCVGERFAYTMTDIGGARPVPDPLQIPLRILDWLDYEAMQMQGNIVHSQPDSWVLVSFSTDSQTTQEPFYDLWHAPMGMDLPMSVFEYTLEDDVATPLAYNFLRYDSPPEGDDGPEAAPQPAEFQRATVRVEYDIAEDSPLHYPSFGEWQRAQEGIMVRGMDSNDHMWIAGLMTSWIHGESFDTFEVAWTDEAFAEAVAFINYIYIHGINQTGPAYSYYARAKLPDNPADFSSVILHDPPDVQDRERMNVVPFDEEVFLRVPDRVDLIRYQVIVMYLDTEAHWFVETPAERSSMVFALLPWPSAVSQFIFMEGFDENRPMLILYGVAYDADPYENYRLWNEAEWDENHYVSLAMAMGLELQPPKN